MGQGELGLVYGDKELIFKEGDEGNCMFVIQSGRVRITKNSDAGEVHIVTLGPGEIFGEMALFDRLPRSATARAEDEARVLSIDKKKLFSTISKDPTVVLKILETMSGTIRRLSRDFTALREQKANTLQVCMNTKEICRMVLGEVQKHIGCIRGMISLLDPKAESLALQAAFGAETGNGGTISWSKEALDEVISTGRVVTLSNSGTEIYIPLKCDESVFGVCFLQKDREFSDVDTDLLRSFAMQASIALRNAINISGFSKLADQMLAHAEMVGPV